MGLGWGKKKIEHSRIGIVSAQHVTAAFAQVFTER
jgi:hypothetical protein